MSFISNCFLGAAALLLSSAVAAANNLPAKAVFQSDLKTFQQTFPNFHISGKTDKQSVRLFKQMLKQSRHINVTVERINRPTQQTTTRNNTQIGQEFTVNYTINGKMPLSKAREIQELFRNYKTVEVTAKIRVRKQATQMVNKPVYVPSAAYYSAMQQPHRGYSVPGYIYYPSYLPPQISSGFQPVYNYPVAKPAYYQPL